MADYVNRRKTILQFSLDNYPLSDEIIWWMFAFQFRKIFLYRDFYIKNTREHHKLFYGAILEKDNYYFYIKYGLGKYKEKTLDFRFNKQKLKLKLIIYNLLRIKVNNLVFIKKENFKGFIKEIKSFDRHIKSPSLVVVVSNGEEEIAYTPKEIWKNF